MEAFFVEPNTLKGVHYFTSSYFHFHKNQTATEIGIDKKKQALRDLPEKKDEER